MQTQTQTIFARSIYADFVRFMLASLAVGIAAAALLSSAVVVLSSHAPRSAAVISAERS